MKETDPISIIIKISSPRKAGLNSFSRKAYVNLTWDVMSGASVPYMDVLLKIELGNFKLLSVFLTCNII